MARFSVMIMDRTKEHWDRDGGWYEQFEKIVEAPNEAEALAMVEAQYNNETYKVLANTLQDIGDEINRYAKQSRIRKAEREAEEKKKAEAKARKEAREEARAKEMGITVEEYRKMKKNEATAKRVRREIEELKAELARKEAYLARLEA